MARLILLVKWIGGMWPVQVPIALALIHYALASNTPSDWSSENALIALVLQIIGGILILYSIDSNLGITNDTSLFGMFWGYMKRFPLIKRSYTRNVQSSHHKMTGYPAKIRVGGPQNTIEEKVAYMQQQINWLKEDLDDELKHLKGMVAVVETKSNEQIAELRENVGSVERKVTTLSVGGIQAQIFGVLLMVHGAVAGYYA